MKCSQTDLSNIAVWGWMIWGHVTFVLDQIDTFLKPVCPLNQTILNLHEKEDLICLVWRWSDRSILSTSDSVCEQGADRRTPSADEGSTGASAWGNKRLHWQRQMRETPETRLTSAVFRIPDRKLWKCSSIQSICCGRRNISLYNVHAHSLQRCYTEVK